MHKEQDINPFFHKDAGTCYEMLPRWYFDNEKAKCLQFVYSGCMGNANNFMSSDECNDKCISWGDDGIEVPITIKGNFTRIGAKCHSVRL